MVSWEMLIVDSWSLFDGIDDREKIKRLQIMFPSCKKNFFGYDWGQKKEFSSFRYTLPGGAGIFYISSMEKFYEALLPYLDIIGESKDRRASASPNSNALLQGHWPQECSSVFVSRKLQTKELKFDGEAMWFEYSYAYQYRGSVTEKIDKYACGSWNEKFIRSVESEWIWEQEVIHKEYLRFILIESIEGV